jgi:hypothetical protein
MILLARDLKRLASLVTHVAKRYSNLIGEDSTTQIGSATGVQTPQRKSSEAKGSEKFRDGA